VRELGGGRVAGPDGHASAASHRPLAARAKKE